MRNPDYRSLTLVPAMIFAILFASLLPTTNAFAGAPREAWYQQPGAPVPDPCLLGHVYCPKTTDDGYVYGYDAVSRAVVKIPMSHAGSPVPGVSYRYTLGPACPLAKPFDAAMCTGALASCAKAGQGGLHEYVWRTSDATNYQQWSIVGDLCSGTVADPISQQQVVADVSEYERVHVPIPIPNVRPSGFALVNLPVLVSAQDPGPQVMSVQQPVPGQLVATPTFTWTFDDGTTLTGPGRPYDGTDPRVEPAHYLAHAYARPEAHASVTLTVTWHATFTAAGQNFTISDLVMPGIVTTFPVYEAKSVLVDGTASPAM